MGKSSVGLVSSVEYITPTIAAQWLTRDEDNAFQRRISKVHVAGLARDMAQGRWMLNGESIVFNGTSILDGRHRLAAIVESQQTVPMLVVRNVDVKAFKTIDLGKKRSPGDILGMAGHTNTFLLAATARFVAAEERGMLAQARNPEFVCTADELLETIGRHPGLTDAARHIKSIDVLMVSSVACYCRYRGEQVYGREATEAFFTALSTGEAITKTMPVYHLREQLLGQQRTRRIPPIVQLAITMKAMIYTAEQRQVRLLTHRVNEEFPAWPTPLDHVS